MNSIWNRNCSLLKERFPRLYSMLEEDLRASLPRFHGTGSGSPEEVDFSCGWKLKKSRAGAWTAEPSLHSRYDPVREAQRFARSLCEQMNESQKTVPVFMGFGLGYGVVAYGELIESAVQTGTVSQGRMNQQGGGLSGLVLVEPDVACFAAALWSLDFEPVFTMERCALLVGASHQSVLGVLESFGLDTCHFVWNKAHTSHSQGYFDGLHTLIQRNLDKDAINSRTLDRFGQLWLRNSCRNLDKLATCDGVSRYQNLGWNLDACVVGAGPSLDLILPHLGKIKERCILIVVDTALRVCLRSGVEPDFVVLGDPQYWNARHLAGLSSPSTVLITEVAAYPPVFRFPCKETVLCSSLYPVGRFFSSNGLDKGDLGAGGSVATSAWGFARLCGCHRIFLAAVDLSFPGKRTHAHGSTFEEKTHMTSTRLAPSQQSQVAALFSADTSLKTSYAGESVITDQRMELYAWWFESKVAAHPEQKTFSLTANSLSIPGIEFFPLEDFLQQAPRGAERQEFFASQQKQREKFLASKEELAATFRHLRSSLKDGLFQIYKAARKGLQLCQDALVLKEGAAFEAAFHQVISQLATIDQAIRTSPYHESAALAFPSQQKLEQLYLEAGLSANPSRATLEKSRVLYQQIMAALADYNEFME